MSSVGSHFPRLDVNCSSLFRKVEGVISQEMTTRREGVDRGVHSMCDMRGHYASQAVESVSAQSTMNGIQT